MKISLLVWASLSNSVIPNFNNQYSRHESNITLNLSCWISRITWKLSHHSIYLAMSPYYNFIVLDNVKYWVTRKTIATFCRKLPKVIYSKSKVNEPVAEKREKKIKKYTYTRLHKKVKFQKSWKKTRGRRIG